MRTNLFEFLWSNAFDLTQLLDVVKHPLGSPILDDATREHRTNAGQLLEILRRRTIQVERDSFRTPGSVLLGPAFKRCARFFRGGRRGHRLRCAPDGLLKFGRFGRFRNLRCRDGPPDSEHRCEGHSDQSEFDEHSGKHYPTFFCN